MAMSGRRQGRVKSDINVTPLVDVMLVLLIIMMIVAPLLQKGVDVKLPTADQHADKPETQDQTVVHVDREQAASTSTPCRSPKRDLATRIEDALEEQEGEDRLSSRPTRTRRTAR